MKRNQENIKEILKNIYGANKVADKKIYTKKKKVDTLPEQIQILKDLLSSKLLFEENPVDETIFQSDLVMKLEVPEQKYLKRPTSDLQIGSFINKPSEKLSKAYGAAIKDLYEDMETKEDSFGLLETKLASHRKNRNQLKIRNIASFNKIAKLQHQQKTDDIQHTGSGMIKDEDLMQPTGLVQKLKKNQKLKTKQGEIQNISYNCVEQYTGILDSFIINYNTLIYILQKQCGFKTRSFIVSKGKGKNKQRQNIQLFSNFQNFNQKQENTQRTIFIYLYTPHQNLLKAASNYRIKKQIDYNLLDPLINQPTDKRSRPIQNHQFIINIMKQQQLRETVVGYKIKQMDLQRIQRSRDNLNNRKTYERKLKMKNFSDNSLSDSIEQLTNDQIQKYISFSESFLNRITQIVGRLNSVCFNSLDPSKSLLCDKQLDYVKSLNRNKLNPGVQKVYMQFKKQKQYIAELKNKSQQFCYITYQCPDLFTEFQLAPKNKGFFDRLKSILKYKPHVVSPSGDLALFNKMERIKIAYLILQEQVKIQKFKQLNVDLFALNDDFERYGIIGDLKQNIDQFHYHWADKQEQQIVKNYHRVQCHTEYEQIEGGLYGTKLTKGWRVLSFWKTNFKIIRGYLGQAHAYSVFVKTQLLKFFTILSIISIVAEIIDFIFISRISPNYHIDYQIIFNLVYLLLITIIYAVFIEIFTKAEQDFMFNYQEGHPTIQFNKNYKGANYRNPIDDKVNDYSQNKIPIIDRIKMVIFFLLTIGMVGLEFGFYFLIRDLIIELSYIIDKSYLIIWYPAQLTGYSIYFFVNYFIIMFIAQPFFHKITKLQNWACQQNFTKSQAAKMYLFIISIELIVPIDLVFIQFAQKKFCQANSCYFQLYGYIYCRYIISLIGVLFLFAKLVFSLTKKKLRYGQKFQASGMQYQLNFIKKLENYLKFTINESYKKQPKSIKLYDQVTVWLQFCTFCIAFPLGAFISFLVLLLRHIIERKQLLLNYRRPISKSRPIKKYSAFFKIALHWMIFFNIAKMVLILQWLEWAFPNIIISLAPTVNFSNILNVKYLFIVGLMLIFQLIATIVRKIVRQNRNMMQQRKHVIHEKFIETKVFQNQHCNLQMKGMPHPLSSISRVYNVNKQIKQLK